MIHTKLRYHNICKSKGLAPLDVECLPGSTWPVRQSAIPLIYQPELAPGVGDTFSLSSSSSSCRSDLFNVRSHLGADRIAVVSASCREFKLAHLAAAGVPARWTITSWQ